MAVKFWIEKGEVRTGSDDSPEYLAFKVRQRQQRQELDGHMLYTISKLQECGRYWQKINHDHDVEGAGHVIQLLDCYQHRLVFTLSTELQHEDFEVLLDFENEGNTNEERIDTFLLTIKDYIYDYEKELEDKEDE